MEHNNPDGVPPSSAQVLSRVTLGSQKSTDNDAITVNVADRDPGGMDPQASFTRPFTSEITGQQTAVRPRASTPFAAPRPTDSIHTDMTVAKPTQPTIPAKPDTLTLDTSIPQRLEPITEFRRSHIVYIKRLIVEKVQISPEDLVDGNAPNLVQRVSSTT